MRAHLDFFDATSETTCLASGILGALSLLRFTTKLWCYLVNIATRMGRGVISSGGDVSVRARGEEGVSVA